MVTHIRPNVVAVVLVEYQTVYPETQHPKINHYSPKHLGPAILYVFRHLLAALQLETIKVIIKQLG